MNASATKVWCHSRAFDAATRYAFDMDISNWDRLDGIPDSGADAFRRQHAAEARLSLEEYDRYLVVIPDGDGWAGIPRTEWKREQKPRSVRKPDYVYFARLGGLIKIGISQNPEKRTRELNAELLGTFEGDRHAESELHREFRDLRENGEWFRPSERLLDRIEALTR